ncbi:hypothetical protein ACQ86G_28245 [Roseateles chitinivorans]|uniref:hypothetical protein n=1 Tax=Roseateles chitinivorans TaxID=2917965 RepID=UPI003D66490D
MHFAEIETGDYRIYAGAIERPRQFGYVAAVVVVRTGLSEAMNKREAFRDENLAGATVGRRRRKRCASPSTQARKP